MKDKTCTPQWGDLQSLHERAKQSNNVLIRVTTDRTPDLSWNSFHALLLPRWNMEDTPQPQGSTTCSSNSASRFAQDAHSQSHRAFGGGKLFEFGLKFRMRVRVYHAEKIAYSTFKFCAGVSTFMIFEEKQGNEVFRNSTSHRITFTWRSLYQPITKYTTSTSTFGTNVCNFRFSGAKDGKIEKACFRSIFREVILQNADRWIWSRWGVHQRTGAIPFFSQSCRGIHCLGPCHSSPRYCNLATSETPSSRNKRSSRCVVARSNE